MIPKLIGIAGPARAGKDTVGTYLKNYHGFKGVFFAEPLKEAARVMFNLSDAQLYGDEKEKPIDWLGKSPRFILQTLGTDWGRELIHSDVWLLVAGRRINSLLGEGTSVCVTDVRFDNEANAIRNLGGCVWHIERRNAQKVLNHASEAGVTRHYDDWVLNNNGSIVDLHDQVEKALAHY